MQKVFSNAAELEKLAKEKFSVPPFLMMENAAQAMADFILERRVPSTAPFRVLILCGKGNNGGDGYALARLLRDTCEITLVAVEQPTAEEASVQYKRYLELGGVVTNQLPAEIEADIIVDCLYGIGFHGELRPTPKEILDQLNSAGGLKLACDVPSAFYFKADYTITMGEHKTALFSDKAKTVCGQIIVADLGLSRKDFQSCLPADAYLIEESDIKLPLRKNKAANKGTYGHTTVFAGEKSGAGIIAGTAAMNFGSGLTTLFKTEHSNLEQFQISPELMISESIPAKTTAVVIGPGLGVPSQKMLEDFKNWFTNAKSPCAIIDADMLTWEGLPEFLEDLNKVENAKIMLTPHLSELSRFVKDYDVKTLADSAEAKLELAAKLNSLYPRTTVIMKSANTFIACGSEVYICKDGVQSLAKGGSGDVLAGMAGALLAQGYSTKDAAITAVMRHALAAREFGEEAYNLTPFKLINLI